MDLTTTLADLGISLGLGLLVGLQREQVGSQLAGLRTFALITLLGTICGLLAANFGGWVIASGFLALTGAIMIGHLGELRGEKIESGATTEIAALAMFGVGAYLVSGYREVAIVLGGGIAVLLHFKGELHGIAARLGDDSKAVMQFVLISMVILPILPNRSYGPYNVLNPRQIWLMVVLIVGIGLGGYIVYKLFGATAGLLLGGVLGGIISSTATTVSYSKRVAKRELAECSAAIVVLLASIVSCLLVLIEVFVVAPNFLRTALAPVSVVIFVLGAASTPIWLLHSKEPSNMPPQSNPSELRGALYFAAMYALILLSIAAVKDWYGDRGLYAVAAASGLAEIHALALSTSQLVASGRLGSGEGWRIIVVAMVSSLAFKFAIVTMVAGRQLWKRLVLPFLLAITAGISIVLLWG